MYFVSDFVGNAGNEVPATGENECIEASPKTKSNGNHLPIGHTDGWKAHTQVVISPVIDTIPY